MTSSTTEPPTLRSLASIAATPPSSAAATASNRRSYNCYNCNSAFHITPTATASGSSPSSFRCPRCYHRHLIPHHTVSPPPPLPPTRPLLTLPPPRNSDYPPGSSIVIYESSDESDSDDDYDSSLLSFTTPNLLPSTPALKSFVQSLPLKTFPPNSTPSLPSCSICMEDFEIGPDTSVIVNELPCEHYFHKDCIGEWLKRSNTCPLCRHKLPADPDPAVGIDLGRNEWEIEYDAVLVVDISPREPRLRRVNREQSLSSHAAAARSSRRVLVRSRGQRSGLDTDAMHDEDGDTLMMDA